MRLIFFLFLISCNLKPLNNSIINSDTDLNIKILYDDLKLNLRDKSIYNEIRKELGYIYDSDNNNYIIYLSNISESSNIALVNRQGEISEYNYNLSVHAKLYEKNCDSTFKCKAIFNRVFSNSLNYNVNNNYYAIENAKNSYRSQLISSIVKEIQNEIIISLIK